MKNKTTTAKMTTMGIGLLTTMFFLFTLSMISQTVSDRDVSHSHCALCLK